MACVVGIGPGPKVRMLNFRGMGHAGTLTPPLKKYLISVGYDYQTVIRRTTLKWFSKANLKDVDLIEVKGHQMSNMVNYVLWLSYLVKKIADAS